MPAASSCGDQGPGKKAFLGGSEPTVGPKRMNSRTWCQGLAMVMSSQCPGIALNHLMGPVVRLGTRSELDSWLPGGRSHRRSPGRGLFLYIAGFLAYAKLTHPTSFSLARPGPSREPTAVEVWNKLDNELKMHLVMNVFHGEPNTKRVMDEAEAKWLGLSSGRRSKLVYLFKDLFSVVIWHADVTDCMVRDAETVRDDLFPEHLTDKLERVLVESLGDDITVEMVWNHAERGQDADEGVDLDLYVWRTGNRANQRFTEEDKQQVKECREEMQDLFDELRVRNVAIKFVVPEQGKTFRHLDLVLYMQRSEEFPCLRGGEDSCANSACIKDFLKEYPAARRAAAGVKTYFNFNLSSPMRMLLEGIAWRLSKTFPLTRGVPDELKEDMTNENLRRESYRFFNHMVNQLRTWKNSSFGDDLRQDLDKLPQQKRAEYEEGFEKFRHVSRDILHYRLLRTVILWSSCNYWTPDVEPFHEYVEGDFHRLVFGHKKPPPRDSGGESCSKGFLAVQANCKPLTAGIC